MNRTIIMAALAQRSKSPIRMVLLSMVFGFPLLGVWAAPLTGLAALQNGFNFGAILAAGMIGQDVSAGVLQLLFARPVKRWEYVVSRWMAFAGAGAVLAVLQVVLGLAILSSRSMSPGTDVVMYFAASQALAAIGAASVFALLSSFVGGLGDVAIFVMLKLAGTVFGVWGSVAADRALLRVSEEIGRFIGPALDVGQVVSAGSIPWFAVTSFLSTVTFCLAVAILRLNRRELSYASA